ncbi:MAG: dockerin type I domain-containing protein, partial [Phycisphaerae bacterium]
DSCVTVSAVYPFGGVIHERSNIVLVEDLDGPLMVVQSDPPDGAIDARQPSRPDGTLPVGYRSVDIKLSGDICFLTRFDFTATQAGGVLGGPFIQSVEAVDARTVRVHLNRDLEPQTWTTVTHIGSGSSVTVGYLPGDVSGDGIVTSDDLLVLIDALNNPAVVLPLRSSDLDRSGSLSPADLLRAVDLIIGADAFDPWNLRSLP